MARLLAPAIFCVGVLVGAPSARFFPAILCAPALAASTQPLLIGGQGEQPLISLKAGQSVAVAFDYAGGTGFAWIPVTPLAAGVRILANETAAAQPGLAGGPVRQTVTFVGDAPGQTGITLLFRRVWLPVAASDPRVILKFEVVP